MVSAKRRETRKTSSKLFNQESVEALNKKRKEKGSQSLNQIMNQHLSSDSYNTIPQTFQLSRCELFQHSSADVNSKADGYGTLLEM
jgi:hypothetical protein